MAIRKIKSKSSQEYSAIYSGIRGVDLRGDGTGISRSRVAYLENMYIDYDGNGGGAIESIPGYRRLIAMDTKIDNLFFHKSQNGEEYVIIHTNNKLYRTTKSALLSGTAPTTGYGFPGNKSTSYTFGSYSFFLNGNSICQMDASGAISRIIDGREDIYIPTTHINGKEYEQRNMLTRRCYQKYYIDDVSACAYGSPGLKYSIIDKEAHTCRLEGTNGEAIADVHIPSRVRLGNEYYSVTEIAPSVFANDTNITSLTIAEGVRSIGKFAFMNCRSLLTVTLPDSLSLIDNGAFDRCIYLKSIHIGLGMKSFSDLSFALCTGLETVSYSGSAEEFAGIENTNIFGNADEYIYNKCDLPILISIPVFGPVKTISAVTVDGNNISNEGAVTVNGLITEVTFSVEKRSTANGSSVQINAILSSDPLDYKDYTGFMGSDICGSNNALNIIRSCSKWAIYDGRPFLSGSYYSPGAIFFATRDKTGLINPHYFGENDFFVTSGGGEVLAMLSCQDALAVFEVDKAGSVSVSYHTPHETGIDMVPVIYPISYTHRGLGNVFGAISFFDDAVFLSKMGLMGLDSQKVNLTRNLTVRSSNVNQMLIREDMSSALMTIWAGYLVIATENRIYLADSRGTFTNDRGGMEYEWFILNGIGGITADSPVYRYSSYGRGQNTPYLGHEDEAVPPSKMIYSGFDDDGMYLFTEVDGQTHPIYQTKERQGGELRPITALLSADNALYFGSDEGSVYVFNSDMRGIPNDAYYLSDDYDEDDYKRRFGSSIDSSHYSFAGHPIRYTVKSANDNGGFPHLLKSDVKNSLTIKCRSGTRGTVVCEVTTDSSTHMKLCEFPSTAFTFDDLDFSSISLCSEEFYTRMIPGREKKWVEKQITLYTEGYCMPFAINNISHRFCLVGNIKKK